MLEIRNISKKYKNKQVLLDISMSVENGTCIGILGRNGAGKSTLLSILAGVQKPDEGCYLYNGQDLLGNNVLRTELVGYVPQGTPLISELTAKDNLLLWYDASQLNRELTNGVLKMLGIDSFLKTRVSKMSGGMKKRLSIGCAVANHPPVLLLDEPTAALDIACKKDITHYLEAYKKAGGIVIITTHDITELNLCDRCYIIKDGVLCPYINDGNVDSLIEMI